MKLGVLIFAAHPDDSELSMCGTIAKFTESGFKVGIIDLTQGEMGTRGSAELRKIEAACNTPLQRLGSSAIVKYRS